MSKYIYRKNGYDFHIGYSRFQKHVFLDVAEAGTREFVSSTVFDYLGYDDMGDYINARMELDECELIAMFTFNISFPKWLTEAIMEDVELLKWSADDTAPSEHPRMLPEYDCYVRVLGGVLYSSPADGHGEETIVTHPESQEFLDAVNTLFETDFKMEQFPA